MATATAKAKSKPSAKAQSAAPVKPTKPSVKATPAQLMIIELSKIKPSGTNPRQFFDEAALNELADSIRIHGLAQPLLVRPEGAGVILVAGERRLRAAKLAGLKSVPCFVREMSEADALELQIIENLQRQDVTPFEEAQGYQRLRDAGHDAAEIAQRIGKSVRHVWQSLSLAQLPEQCIEDLRAGTLSKSQAMEIATLPSEKMRKDAVKDFRQWNGQYLTVQAIRENIANKYRKELKGAIFDRKDAELLPTAGSCHKCPKRTGNAKDLYPDGRDDVCTDTTCYDKKVVAHHSHQLTAWRDAGRKVITGKLANDAIGWNGGLAHGAEREWALPAEVCPKDDKGRTWAVLLKGHAQPTILQNGSHTTLEAFPLAEVYPLLKEHHGIKPPKLQPAEAPGKKSSTYSHAPLADDVKQRVRAIRTLAAHHAMQMAVYKLVDYWQGCALGPIHAAFFHSLVSEFLNEFSGNDLAKEWFGIEKKASLEELFKDADSRKADEWFVAFGVLCVSNAADDWRNVAYMSDLKEGVPDRDGHPLVDLLALDWDGFVETAEAELGITKGAS